MEVVVQASTKHIQVMKIEPTKTWWLQEASYCNEAHLHPCHAKLCETTMCVCNQCEPWLVVPRSCIEVVVVARLPWKHYKLVQVTKSVKWWCPYLQVETHVWLLPNQPEQVACNTCLHSIPKEQTQPPWSTSQKPDTACLHTNNTCASKGGREWPSAACNK